MMNFTVAVGFVLLALPLLIIMMGIAIYSDMKAAEVDLETNEDLY